MNSHVQKDFRNAKSSIIPTKIGSSVALAKAVGKLFQQKIDNCQTSLGLIDPFDENFRLTFAVVKALLY